jgi:hypothetical protein
MFCPECRAEYRPGFTRCSDCDVDLVHELPEPDTAIDAVQSSMIKQLPPHDNSLQTTVAAYQSDEE